jgi:hypothetical protein
MNIRAAWMCYDIAKHAGNQEAALRHLKKIRVELKYRGARKRLKSRCFPLSRPSEIQDSSGTQSKPSQENIPAVITTDRVRSIFDHE